MMEHSNLNARLLDTAIKTVERNRTLLFTINLISALILVVVYLELSSFDTQQRETHLVAFQERCVELYQLLEKVPNRQTVPPQTLEKFYGCSDLDAISNFVVINTNINTNFIDIEESNKYKQDKEKLLKDISKAVFRLHRIRNAIKSTELDSANVAPLGFGLSVPRNDLVLICGVLLVILYSWLAFSFAQHVRITEKIKQLFKESGPRENDKTQASINDIIELNFLFLTSKSKLTTLFVWILYVSAPIAMTAANINDFYPDATKLYKGVIEKSWLIPAILQIFIMLILWAIGIQIIRLDKSANVKTKSQAKVEKPADTAPTES